MGITEAKASAKPTHLPSATRPSVVTKQNTAKLHIPGKNPRRNRIVVCGPCCTCVKAIRMASATGKGVRAPLRVGPRLGARPVVVSTRATAEITRRGMSQTLRVAGAAPSPRQRDRDDERGDDDDLQEEEHGSLRRRER